MHIQTSRLELREYTLDDINSLHALLSIPSVARYQTWEPRTLAQAEEVVQEIVENQDIRPRRHFELAVIHNGTFIGSVGAKIKNRQASLWYSLMPTSQGRGFATEAVSAFILLLGDVTLEIECDPRNTGSWKLAERLGFVKARFIEKDFECKGEWVDSLVYQRVP
ncbi:acyl-CoA N-acyltransferase [Glonium stellatum]|uniref:Acyl-CoA N-acyltransferase n=1 Tax=Glonium stellatum TaxID=574774 RepID=A0A8E2F452_9PEZI|nr:acyl-CoA N-acyltransferase [Glonium stellatum]